MGCGLGGTVVARQTRGRRGSCGRDGKGVWHTWASFSCAINWDIEQKTESWEDKEPWRLMAQGTNMAVLIYRPRAPWQ